MPARKDDLKDGLSRHREINITVTGRKSGRAITNPVWFVLENEKFYLLPVSGSDTQWYKNVLSNPSIRIEARGTEAKLEAVPVTDAKQVSSVVEKFHAKYGAGDVKEYYSKFRRGHTCSDALTLRPCSRCAQQEWIILLVGP